jgi:hypothetical protein
MCGQKVSVDDVLQRHGTPSQTEPASTPEAIQDQQSSGGPLEKYQCSGTGGVGFTLSSDWGADVVKCSLGVDQRKLPQPIGRVVGCAECSYFIHCNPFGVESVGARYVEVDMSRS